MVIAMGATVTGTFETGKNGAGYLRNRDADYRVRPNDVTVPPDVCRKFRLRGGESVEGVTRKGKAKGRYRNGTVQLAEVITINGMPVNDYLDAKPFEDLTPINPERAVRFETPGGPLSMRVVDLMTPIGFGQRGLIAAPPRSGKTVLLQQMAHGVAVNHPDAYMMVLLIDERPEEVTEMRRTVHGEVVASSNDNNIASHVRIARLMIAKAKRMVEAGTDVIVLLDSLTRLGRAFNAAMRGSGRTMSGGLDVGALAEPKAIFGAARNIEGGGSLTIIASALIETGSRMDEVIFNEFKGTGNMEIMLSRELSNLRIWPAIDLALSGTRKEELLLSPEMLEAAHNIRRNMVAKDPRRSMEQLLESLGKHPDMASYIKTQAQPQIRRRFST